MAKRCVRCNKIASLCECLYCSSCKEILPYEYYFKTPHCEVCHLDILKDQQIYCFTIKGKHYHTHIKCCEKNQIDGSSPIAYELYHVGKERDIYTINPDRILAKAVRLHKVI